MVHGIPDLIQKLMLVYIVLLFFFLVYPILIDFQKLGQQERELLIRGHGSLLRTDEALKTTNQTAHETEQLGHTIMGDLITQRETLLRTQDKVKIYL